MTTALEYFAPHKQQVDKVLTTYLSRKKTELEKVNYWAADVIDRLSPFVTAGKTIRGSLVLYTHALFGSEPAPYVYDSGAALELFQAGFLIHDDIMDRDSLRRGKPSIHEQYAQLERSLELPDADHFGESMGINAGDLCFFLGYELLCSIPHTFDLRTIIGKEMEAVVIAQMQDVAGATSKGPLTTESVLSLYRYKTARYTFSLPMVVGATLANAAPETIVRLDRLGESMGLLFQIRDDELSVEGDSQITGKPVGSDERNAKNTLATLMSGESINEFKTTLLEHAEQEIAALSVTDDQKKQLTTLVHYCLTRDK